MPNILVVKSSAFLTRKQLQGIFDSLKTKKETGVILLPSYLEAKIVPDDIEIKLAGPDGSEIMFVDTDKNYLKRRKAINSNFLSKISVCFKYYKNGREPIVPEKEKTK